MPGDQVPGKPADAEREAALLARVEARLDELPPKRFSGTDGQFTRWLRENAGRLGTRALVGYAEAVEATCWVLVKGYHDSGTIDGVYGPYTEAYADWLLAGPLDGNYSNWTKTRLSSGPEETRP